ncbi:MAG: adenosylcobinamide-GDP ribazoletransferase [Propionibacteriaceae bacterium]|jgi:adenosylcobinamide-GDP ribazoletransferase|nr:adenosylcobinamide-GDP ribazoletransferase [Propionibacteriaceae bacterium]
MEIRLFLTAVMFYTRIPCPSWVGYSEDQLNRSTRYFPLIGWIVGSFVSLVIYGALWLFPPTVAVILGLGLGVLLTGSFHEDGFADFCDGFGGGTTAEGTLAIMKDSRVGTYAVVSLIMLLGLKFFAVVSLVESGSWFAALVFAHVASRWCVTTIIFKDEYARADATSKVKPIGRKISKGGLALATFWLLLTALLFLGNPTRLWCLTTLIPAFLIRVLLAAWFRRRLGGYTGDCLGAAQQIIEVGILLAILALARFI